MSNSIALCRAASVGGASLALCASAFAFAAEPAAEPAVEVALALEEIADAEGSGDDSLADAAVMVAPKRVEAVLAAYTPVKVMMDQELSTQTHSVGDQFFVTVVEDVVENDTVVVPAGSHGWGEVTFATKKGGFGKPGIVGISLRSLELGDRIVSLDGRYREEGKNKNGAVAATWLAVGIFSGFIKGRAGYIEKGRELRARIGEELTYFIGEDAERPVIATDIAEETELAAGTEPQLAPETVTGDEAAGIAAPDQQDTI